MRTTKSSDNIQFLPFLMTCLNNLGWLYYGILKKDGTVIFVNVIGACLQVLYISCYCLYSKEKRRVITQSSVAAAVLALGWLYFCMLLPPGDSRLDQLGLTCSVATVCMYASPLTDLVAIVRSGSLERLSFSLSVATFFTSTSWVLYGLQLHDYYIMVPNTPGIFTSLIRLFLFWRFSSGGEMSAAYKPLKI